MIVIIYLGIVVSSSNRFLFGDIILVFFSAAEHSEPKEHKIYSVLVNSNIGNLNISENLKHTHTHTLNYKNTSYSYLISYINSANIFYTQKCAFDFNIISASNQQTKKIDHSKFQKKALSMARRENIYTRTYMSAFLFTNRSCKRQIILSAYQA